MYTCNFSGKRQFTSSHEALNRHHKNNKQQRGYPYVCPNCEMFHITTSPDPGYDCIDITFGTQDRKMLERFITKDNFIMWVNQKCKMYRIKIEGIEFTVLYDVEYDTVAVTHVKTPS